MTENAKHARPTLRNSFVAFSVFLPAFYWLVVATYPEFFIFNPFEESWVIRQAALLLSLLGWVAISTIPAAALLLYSVGSKRYLRLLPFAALLWPVSVVINQVLLYVRDQTWYFDYLVNFPIFIATDILLPALVLFLWSELRHENGHHAFSERQPEQSQPSL